MKRDHEEATRQEFDRILRAAAPMAFISWKEVAEGHDPPDWMLTFNDERYAVEATSIVELVAVEGAASKPAPTLNRALQAWIQEVEVLARERGILKGLYEIAVAPIPNFPKRRAQLEDRILEYLSSTKEEEAAPELDFGRAGSTRLSIRKFANAPTLLAATISFGAKNAEQAQKELESYLGRILARKAQGLQKVAEQKLLLLLDNSWWEGLRDWAAAIETVPERHEFSCIYRVVFPNRSSLLWSDSDEWRLLLGG